MYTNEFAERIDIAIDRIGGVGKASSIIGVSNPTIGRWKDGSSDAKLSNMVAFAKAANVSLDWLVFGEGKTEVVSDIQIQEDGIAANDTNYAYIPAYDIEASAGHGSCIGVNEVAHKHLAFRMQWLRKRGLKADDLVGIFTKGDSMEPTIADGGAIIIDKSRSQIIDSRVYVISINGDLFVKRVQRLPNGLKLISDNKFYDPLNLTNEDIKNSDIKICGQVIHASYDLPD